MLNRFFSHFFKLWIRGYQLLISPLLPARCRFYPTCSNYALVAIGKHGPFYGLLLAGVRLLKCHPFHEGGVDCVPDQFPTKQFISRSRKDVSHG